jgi:hypothetical protein
MPRAPLFVPNAHEPGKEGQAGEGGLSVCDSGRSLQSSARAQDVVVGRIRRLLPRVRHESSMCVSIGAGSAGKGSCSRARHADLYM